MGSFYGAWDYIAANAQKELISQLFMGYKKEKHLQQFFGKSMRDYQLSPEARIFYREESSHLFVKPNHHISMLRRKYGFHKTSPAWD